MPKIGKRSYPDNFEKIGGVWGKGGDQKMMIAFSLFANKDRQIFAKMAFCTTDEQTSTSRRYNMFFGPGASMKIKLSSSAQARIDELVLFTKGDNDKEINKLYEALRKGFVKELNAKAMKKFYQSEAFVDYHCNAVTKKKNLGLLVDAAAKKLRIKKPKNIETLREVLTEALLGNAQKAKKQCEKFEQMGFFGPLVKAGVYMELRKLKYV